MSLLDKPLRKNTCHECGCRIGSQCETCEVCWQYAMDQEVEWKANREDAYAGGISDWGMNALGFVPGDENEP